MRRIKSLVGVTLLVTIGVAGLPLTPIDGADAKGRHRCGYHPVPFHEVTSRRNITCEEAKRVLLRLRGNRDTIPMVCGEPGTIKGWRVTNLERSVGTVFNRYSRGRVSLDYMRTQNAYRRYCPPTQVQSEGV